MTTLFSAVDYDTLHALVFRDDYPGYRPHVTEAPNGDGSLDTGKRFSHVATKYLDMTKMIGEQSPERDLFGYLVRAHSRAHELAVSLGVPAAFWPSFGASALRVLEYPPCAASHQHTDFDLFTINCYRNIPNAGLPTGEVHMGELGELLGLGPATPHSVLPSANTQRSLVYFAIPDHAAVLPSGQTVGKWLAERVARSRYDAPEAK